MAGLLALPWAWLARWMFNGQAALFAVPDFEGANAFFKCEFGIKNHKRSIQEVAFGLLQRLGGGLGCMK